MKKLYVGNLAYSTTEADLTELFSQYGDVAESIVIQDRYSGRSKGFGFVEMKTEEGASAALALDETEFQGRKLRVNVAKEREPRRGGGNGGGGRDRY